MKLVALFAAIFAATISFSGTASAKLEKSDVIKEIIELGELRGYQSACRVGSIEEDFPSVISYAFIDSDLELDLLNYAKVEYLGAYNIIINDEELSASVDGTLILAGNMSVDNKILLLKESRDECKKAIEKMGEVIEGIEKDLADRIRKRF